MSYTALHQLVPFPGPVQGGDASFLPTVVRGNDNAVVTAYNAHDADATIHLTGSGLSFSLTAGTHLLGGPYNGSAAVTLTTDATNLNTASTIVARDGVGAFSAGAITSTQFNGPLTGAVTGNVTGNLTGNVTGNLTGAVTGNASTATTLQTARAINGVNFDGSAAITVTAAAGTLTGATLNATVLASSLTSVGTLSGGAVPASLVNAGTFGAGAYTFPGALAVTGAATFSSTLGVTGATTSGGLVSDQLSARTATGLSFSGSTVGGSVLLLSFDDTTGKGTMAKQLTLSTGAIVSAGNLKLNAGNSLTVGSTGAVPFIGTATLVAGTVTVTNANIVTADRIFLSRVSVGGTIGTALTYTITNGTSFTINSNNVLDTSVVVWFVIHDA